jgi:hypothetical protein
MHVFGQLPRDGGGIITSSGSIPNTENNRNQVSMHGSTVQRTSPASAMAAAISGGGGGGAAATGGIAS